MSVTKYKNPKCNYSLDRLENIVYLVSEDALKDIRIDDGEAYIDSISETPKVIRCYGIEFTDDTSFDERYEFLHTLNFSVGGYMNHRDLEGRYFAIIKSKDSDTYWLINPIFPTKVTYVYTLGENGNHTDFTLSTKSNYPTLRLNGFNSSNAYECKSYSLCNLKGFTLNETKYTKYSGNKVVYTNDGFKEVVYKRNSATFTETFDGDTIQHQLSFDVDFDDYKSSWHYNLLEFTDNKYATVIDTNCGKHILCGFEHGLQPSFTVNANGEQGDVDRISITLIDSHDDGLTIAEADEIEYEQNTTITYHLTSKYDGYECVGANTARYLLMEGRDIFGNPMGGYKVFNGYESRFSGLDIVGTFTEEVTFPNAECGEGGCRLHTSIPTTIRFTKTDCHTYTMRCDSPWEIVDYPSYITVDVTSGLADRDYIITICNTQAPKSSGSINGSLKIKYCGSLERNVSVVVEQGSDCLTQGLTYNVSANDQYLRIPTQCCVKSVKGVSGNISLFNIYESYFTAYVPQNDSGRERQFIILVEFCDGHTENVTIVQGANFEKWVVEGTICVEGNKYELERLYTGITTSFYNQTNTTRSGKLIEENSSDCSTTSVRWVNTNETTCYNGYKWSVMIEEERNGSGEWIPTGRSKLGETVEDPNGDCEGIYGEETWVVDGWICNDTTKYQRLRKYIDGIATDIYKQGSVVIETNSKDCGWIKGSEEWEYEKWVVVDDDYFCDDGNKYAKERRYVSDDGIEWTPTDIYRKSDIVLEANSDECGYDPKWEDYNCSEYRDDGDTICDGWNKYHYLRKYFRKCEDCSNCSSAWEASDIYKVGGIVEEKSFDCGYIPTEKCNEWREVGTICDDTDKYKQYRKYISDTCDGVRWYETDIYKRGDSPIEVNSEDCGYVATYEYRWVLTNLTECDTTESSSTMYPFKVRVINGEESVTLPCDGSSTLTSKEMYDLIKSIPSDFFTYEDEYTNYVDKIIIGDCVKTVKYISHEIDLPLDYVKEFIFSRNVKEIYEVDEYEEGINYGGIRIIEKLYLPSSLERCVIPYLPDSTSSIIFEEGFFENTIGDTWHFHDNTGDLVFYDEYPKALLEDDYPFEGQDYQTIICKKDSYPYYKAFYYTNNVRTIDGTYNTYSETVGATAYYENGTTQTVNVSSDGILRSGEKLDRGMREIIIHSNVKAVLGFLNYELPNLRKISIQNGACVIANSFNPNSAYAFKDNALVITIPNSVRMIRNSFNHISNQSSIDFGKGLFGIYDSFWLTVEENVNTRNRFEIPDSLVVMYHSFLTIDHFGSANDMTPIFSKVILGNNLKVLDLSLGDLNYNEIEFNKKLLVFGSGVANTNCTQYNFPSSLRDANLFVGGKRYAWHDDYVERQMTNFNIPPNIEKVSLVNSSEYDYYPIVYFNGPPSHISFYPSYTAPVYVPLEYLHDYINYRYLSDLKISNINTY